MNDYVVWPWPFNLYIRVCVEVWVWYSLCRIDHSAAFLHLDLTWYSCMTVCLGGNMAMYQQGPKEFCVLFCAFFFGLFEITANIYIDPNSWGLLELQKCKEITSVVVGYRQCWIDEKTAHLKSGFWRRSWLCSFLRWAPVEENLWIKTSGFKLFHLKAHNRVCEWHNGCTTQNSGNAMFRYAWTR